MDNQNTNEFNENSLEQNENSMNNEVVSQNSEESTSTANTSNILESTIVEPTPTVEPVKPTLDSILNGSVGEETTVQPVALTNENVNLESSDSSTSEVPNNPNSAPTIETIPMDTVVDSSANVAPTIETMPEDRLKEEPVVENVTSNETNIQDSVPTSEPTIVDLNPTLNEPVIEKIEEPTPVENSVPSGSVVNESVDVLEVDEPNVETLEETSIDDFNAVPVPPILDEDKKGKKNKESNKKTLILLLILILIIAIGLGIYYFLTLAKNSTKISITTKEVKVELGSALSTNIDDYVTVSGYDKTSCTIDLDKIDTEKVGTYKYTITCGKENQDGIVMVDDTTKPEVITNDLILLPDSTLNAEDFIEECLDASACSYEFETDVTNLTKTVGEYEVKIIVSDEYNNKNTIAAKLIVSRTAPARYLTCKKAEESIEDIKANLVVSYKIGIDASDNFYNAVRISTFKFQTPNDYTKMVNDYNETVGINGITGKATFNENGSEIILKENKTLEDMNKDLNGKLPNNSNILKAFLSGLGYTCN